jgi:hypothetical protein
MPVAIGPVEYLIVAFPGNQFNGEIAPALADLVESGTIRLLDLVFVTKDADGNVAIVEYDEHDGLSAFAEIDGEVGGVISHEDIDHATHDLPANSSAAVLVWEDVWATPFAEAMRDSGAVLIEAARIPHDLIEPLVAELESN